MSNIYETIGSLKRYTDSVGSIYGTEDFSVYLYSMIKMMKPNTVVEFGTGLGSSMLWSALALKENGFGKIVTVDDGSEWYRLKTAREAMLHHYREDYSEFIHGLIKNFELQDNVVFLNKKIDTLNIENIDILFSDFAHGVFDVVKLLVDYLPRMSKHSRIYIDSVSTHYPSYMAIERIVDIMNSGKMPRVFSDIDSFKIHSVYLSEKIQNSEFKIEHIVENKDRNQNSTCCITVSPIDIFPHPRKNIRSI